ncbi:MAG: hypothetical protein AAGK05_17080 [Pseudomonadota bacterium]
MQIFSAISRNRSAAKVLCQVKAFSSFRTRAQDFFPTNYRALKP